MLGSAADAEDALQRLVAAPGAACHGSRLARSAPGLYKIATNTCLRAIERRPRRVLPVDYRLAADPHDTLPSQSSRRCGSNPTRMRGWGWGSDPASPEARYEQREGVELAFIAALQHLPARQRAGQLILRDVLGFSARETATALETTPGSTTAPCSALQDSRLTTAGTASRRRCAHRATTRCDSSCSATSPPGAQRRRRGRRHAGRRRQAGHAAPCQPGTAAANRSPPSFAVGRCAGRRAGAHSCSRERAARLRPLRLGRQDTDLHAARHRRAHLRGAQIQEITAFVTQPPSQLRPPRNRPLHREPTHRATGQRWRRRQQARARACRYHRQANGP